MRIFENDRVIFLVALQEQLKMYPKRTKTAPICNRFNSINIDSSVNFYIGQIREFGFGLFLTAGSGFFLKVRSGSIPPGSATLLFRMRFKYPLPLPQEFREKEEKISKYTLVHYSARVISLLSTKHVYT